MKQSWKILALAALLSPASALADAPQAVVKQGDHVCVTGIDGDVCSHFFGEMDVALSVAAGGEGCSKMKAVLMQVTARLEAPVDGAVTPASFDGCKPQDLSVHLPKVDHDTEFQVNFSHDGGKGEPIIVPIMAYPRDLLDPIKSWVKDDANALIVKDKDGKLAGFLDRNKIDYSTDGASAKAHKITVVVADPAEMKDDKPSGDVMYLAEKVKDMPLVTVERTASGATATADMKLIERLDADDPLAEKAFVQIFTMITK